MEVIVIKSKLDKAINNILHFVPNKPSLPVLNNLFVEANTDTNQLTLKATDLEMGAEITLGAKVEQKGQLLINGRVLNDIIRNMVGDSVKLIGRKNDIEIQGDHQKIKIITEDVSDYPPFQIKPPTTKNTLNLTEIKHLLKKTAFSVSKDEIRPILTGLLIKASAPNQVEVVSTDGVRLSLLRLKGINWGGAKVIPVRFWQEIVNLFTDTVNIAFEPKKKQILAWGNEGDLQIKTVTQLLEGEYPNYESIIPNRTNLTITTNRQLFIQRLKVVMVMAKENGNIIKLRFNNNTISLTASSSIRGQAETEIEAEISPPPKQPVEIAINGRFLQEAIEVIDDEYLSFGVNDKLKPVLIRGVENDDYLHIIMPVNLSE